MTPVRGNSVSPGPVTRVVRTRRRKGAPDDLQSATASAAEKKKPYYDDRDRAALRLMTKLRVDWTQQEDSFLLLCRVASAFLCRNSGAGGGGGRQHMVSHTAIRDLLHQHFPESANKTSRACQRRINYMLKNQTTADNVALYLAEVQQDEKVRGEREREQK